MSNIDIPEVNACGTCTLCCRLMAVHEISKPRCVWCQHVSSDKHSCNIYEDRPEGCRYWTCGWLSSQNSDIPLPADMRPNACHVVIALGASGTIWFHCDPFYPEAWRKDNVGQLLNKLVHAGHRVIITIGDKRIVFRKNEIPVHFYEKEPEGMLHEDELEKLNV